MDRLKLADDVVSLPEMITLGWPGFISIAKSMFHKNIFQPTTFIEERPRAEESWGCREANAAPQLSVRGDIMYGDRKIDPCPSVNQPSIYIQLASPMVPVSPAGWRAESIKDQLSSCDRTFHARQLWLAGVHKRRTRLWIWTEELCYCLGFQS